MNLTLLAIALILLFSCNLLIRSKNKSYNLASLGLFIVETAPLILIYGVMAGVIIAIASFLIIGLLTALSLGKAK